MKFQSIKGDSFGKFKDSKLRKAQEATVIGGATYTETFSFETETHTAYSREGDGVCMMIYYKKTDCK